MSNPDRVRPAFTELALVLCGMVLGVAALSILRSFGLWPSSTRGLGLVSGPAITGIAAAFYHWAQARLVEAGHDASAVHGPLTKAPIGRSALVVVAMIAAALGGSMAIGAVLDLLGLTVSEQGSVLDIVESWRDGSDRSSIVVLAVSAIVLAPVVEEWLFRGLLFARLRRSSGRTFAYVATALAFAAIHGNPAGFPIYAWLGVSFALTLERTGRLGAAVLVHMGNNAFVFAALVLGVEA